MLVLAAPLPSLAPLLGRLTRGLRYDDMEQNGMENHMGAVAMELLRALSSVACGELSTVLMTELAAET